MYSSRSGCMPLVENAAQAGQVSEPYSTSLTGASGLPASQPPSGVISTVSAHVVPAGGGTAATGSALGGPPSTAESPQAASASASGAARTARRSGRKRVIERFLAARGKG